MVRKTMTVAATLVGALAFGVAAAAPAAAADKWQHGTKISDPNVPYWRCVGDSYVDVCFVPDGDRIYVHDAKADGASAVADWRNYKKWNDPGVYRTGQCVNSNGAGTWVVCNKNFYEDGSVVLNARTYDFGSSKWKHDGPYESYSTS
ncbi:hypothetical protein ACFYVL_34290 [Streptomyces sp. NPDC004111]|uniref:hypothetical protein n=1 Tax=Streptomyces sp. NPDC004111 TaxID=3364690 RepID=UPI0036CD1420